MSERDSSEFETSEFCLKTETRVSVQKQEMDFDRTVIPEQIQGLDFNKSTQHKYRFQGQASGWTVECGSCRKSVTKNLSFGL